MTNLPATRDKLVQALKETGNARLGVLAAWLESVNDAHTARGMQMSLQRVHADVESEDYPSSTLCYGVKVYLAMLALADLQSQSQLEGDAAKAQSDLFHMMQLGLDNQLSYWMGRPHEARVEKAAQEAADLEDSAVEA